MVVPAELFVLKLIPLTVVVPFGAPSGPLPIAPGKPDCASVALLGAPPSGRPVQTYTVTEAWAAVERAQAATAPRRIFLNGITPPLKKMSGGFANCPFGSRP